MTLLLTTDVLYLIGEHVVSASTWTDGITRVYDEVWYETGCSLSVTNRLFAQVFQPLLFRYIELANINHAKRFYALTLRDPRFTNYVSTLAIVNVGRFFPSSSSTWTTWLYSTDGMALLSRLKWTTQLIIKNWDSVNSNIPKGYEELENVSTALTHCITTLRTIRFEECRFRTWLEPLSWTLRCINREYVTVCIGKSNSIEAISDGSSESITMHTNRMTRGRAPSLNLYVDWSHLALLATRTGLEARLKSWSEPCLKMQVGVTSLLPDSRYPMNARAFRDDLSQIIRGFLVVIAELPLADFYIRGVHPGHVPIHGDDTNMAAHSHDKPTRNLIAAQRVAWSTMNDALTEPGILNSKVQLTVAVDYPKYEHHEKWESLMQELLPTVYGTGRLKVVRDDLEYLW
jgi:hypothetical protein